MDAPAFPKQFQIDCQHFFKFLNLNFYIRLIKAVSVKGQFKREKYILQEKEILRLCNFTVFSLGMRQGIPSEAHNLVWKSVGFYLKR